MTATPQEAVRSTELEGPAAANACVVCGKSLATRASLKRHLTQVHRSVDTVSVPEQRLAEYSEEVPALEPLPASFYLPDVPPGEVGTRGKRRRGSILAAVLVLLLAVGGAAAYLMRPQTDAHYLTALKKAQLLDDYPSKQAAVAHGKRFCQNLTAGHDDVGYASERIAVQFYCKSFITGFKVIPTPAEQQKSYLQSLRDGGYGGVFPSDAAAVAHAKAVCTQLTAGGKQQGMPVDLVGVQTYCNDFTAGYHVLETATVEGSFTLLDPSPSIYYSSIASYGGSCTGTGGYSDIHSGTEVTVTNGTGKTLAHTELGSGRGGITSCEFTFQLKLTEGQDDYVVTVSHRGELHYTFTQLQTDGLALTLGS